MEERKPAARKKHQLSLKNREQLAVDGVVNVESFDNQEIVLETDGGLLLVRGDDLHIKELNLDNATLSVEGYVRNLEYAPESAGKKGRGLLGKLFK